MANHSKHARSSTFVMPSKSSLVKIAATVAAVGLLATGGIVSRLSLIHISEPTRP